MNGTVLADEFMSSGWFRSTGTPIAVILAVALVFTLVVRIVVGRLNRRWAAADAASGSITRRAATLTQALTNTVLIVIWTVAILIVLSEFGADVGPLLASAGILGVALGFGAQSLVRDGLSGFFILLENQFDIGDSVDAFTTAGIISGRVEAFSMRVTAVRLYDGALNYIPNGNIQVVANKSRGWARAIVDVRVAYDVDMDRVRATLEELFDSLREAEMSEVLESGPEVLGVQTFAADAQVIRVIADTVPGHRLDAERILRERISARFAEKGIRVVVPHVPPAAPHSG